MSRPALVTLVLGETYQRDFQTYLQPGWEKYCARHGLDLIVLDAPLDGSERARSRSAAWQKCLVAGAAQVAGRERIAWVDADIAINPEAPNLFETAPVEKIGAVDHYAIPTREECRRVLELQYAEWQRAGIPYVSNLTAREFHGHFGIDCPGENVVQTGVLVLSPKWHRAILEKAYDSYEEKGGPEWSYEMRPLSAEIILAGLAHWIPVRFNMLWSYCEAAHYPFLHSDRVIDPAWPQPMRDILTARLWRGCVETALKQNYFLHFAGGGHGYRFLEA